MSARLHVVPYNASLQKLAFSFHSGNNYLDRFLRSSLALDDGFGKTYVFLSDDDNAIIGYYNVGTGYIEQISNDMRHKLGGSVHINCFALDERYHGLLQAETEDGTKVNLSDVLLDDCIQRILTIRAEQIGFAFITLCSTREGHSLYKRNDFDDLEEDMRFSIEESDKDCLLMYLPLDIEE